MNNIYGVPSEVGGWPPSEAEDVECPYCKGVNTEMVAMNESQILAVYACYDCEVEFVEEIEIPF